MTDNHYVEKIISGWGLYPKSSSKLYRPERSREAHQFLKSPKPGQLIARGSGLAYGDAATNSQQAVMLTQYLNHIISFDENLGIIHCQAGTTLEDILNLCIPRGWFLAVTPGTARASAGGCLACDVHGKNHHTTAGSFANHISNVHILTGAGNVVICDKEQNSDLFWATAGGMGLTGIILELSIQLIPIVNTRLDTKNIPTSNLEETFLILDDNNDFSYSVAWLNGTSTGSRLGKGIVMLAEHINEHPQKAVHEPINWSPIKRYHLPIGLPAFATHKYLMALANSFIYHSYSRPGKASQAVSFKDSFYPLDIIDNWNILFGKAGFVEYQIVVPVDTAFEVLKTILEMMIKNGYHSFFSSMKRMGKANAGILSFPIDGYCMSLDIQIQDKKLFKLLDTFDELVVNAGGRVYLAKDSRLGQAKMQGMYPALEDMKKILQQYDPNGVYGSDMSRRLGLT